MIKDDKQSQKLSTEEIIAKYSEIQTILNKQASNTSGSIVYIEQNNGHLTLDL